MTEAGANELPHAGLDPVAKIPGYKVCAVAIEAPPGTPASLGAGEES